MLDGEAEAITRKAIELAKAGDSIAMRLCLDRIAPPRKDRLVTLDLPDDIAAAMAAAVAAMAKGEITPSEAATIVGLLDAQRRGLELTAVEQRLVALEQKP
jgi:hypothetical protein